MIPALAFVVGYLLGSIPFGLILTRAAGGPDVRTIGSGNIGATNVLRTGRKGLAAATLLCDALKGTAAVLLAAHFATPDAALVAGLGAFLGHLFPVWLKFKGGKGVAVYIGVLIGLYWPAALIFCAIWLVGCGAQPLFLARGFGRQRADPAGAVAARPATHRRIIPAAERPALDHAPRQYRPPAQRQRRQDRGKSHARRLTLGCNPPNPVVVRRALSDA